MKRSMAFLFACSILFSVCSTAMAEKMWDAHWAVGEYIIEPTQENIDAINELWKEIDERSQGSGVRTFREEYTMEDERQDYLDGKTASAERYYEDVGVYHWEPGLPDENSIPKSQAFYIAILALCEQYDLDFEFFVNYYPQFYYEVGYPENPTWNIKFLRYDNSAGKIYKVQLHAYNGSILGIRRNGSVG